MPSALSVDLRGDGPLLEATVAAARALGWDPNGGPDVIALAPLGPTVAACDALIEQPLMGRRALGWPTVSVTAVQQLIVRCGGIGAITNLSSRSTRPVAGRADDRRAALLHAAHDQIALLLLLSQLTRLGPPMGTAWASSPDADRLSLHFDTIIATVEVRWDDAIPPALDVQVAGADGVLRIETDPSTRLEHNGAPVPLPAPPAVAPELRALRDTGIIAMLQTIGTSFADGRPLAHAFSFEFGRSVVALVEQATYSSSA